jgi:hypothetical protein
MTAETEISKIILYEDKSTSNLDLFQIKEYLLSRLGKVDIEIRNRFENYFLESKSHEIQEGIAERLANSKIREIMDPKKTIKPLLGEINIEKNLLADPLHGIPGIFYDGYRLHELFSELLPEDEVLKNICHIIFTPRLFGTFDKYDRRYHARVILCGYPSMISTSGIVEAPAKPKEYYKIKEGLLRQNITTVSEFMPDELKEKYLKYDDPKITEVLIGYSMQVIFFHLNTEPFCTDPNCRLFNAHWQEEVLQAQLSTPEYCQKHEEILRKYNE